MKRILLQSFMNATGLCSKTSRWLYDNVLHPDDKREMLKHRHFFESDINTVKQLQLGKFDVKHNLLKISGYSLYWVSPEGRIYTYLRGFFEEIKLSVNKADGYAYVTLYNRATKEHKTHRFARLVAEAFIANPNNLPVINHKDGNKLNNHIDNLEWTTISGNTKHAFDNGLTHNDIGEEDSQSMPIDVIFHDNSIKHFGSCREAERETGISISTFTRLARSGKVSRKFNFKVKFCTK